MADSIDFFIDDKPYSTYKAIQSVTEVLALAGLTADQFFLISSDGTKFLDGEQNVEIRSGEHFTTKKRDRDAGPKPPELIQYQVNGENQKTVEKSLSVEQILRSAGKGASIDLRQLDSYILENIKTGQKYERLDDIVDISDGDQFLAVHSGATPVALFLTA